MRVSEICVKQIRVNQGLGVLYFYFDYFLQIWIGRILGRCVPLISRIPGTVSSAILGTETEYCIVVSTNSCYYSEKQIFCFLKSRILTCCIFFLGIKLFYL